MRRPDPQRKLPHKPKTAPPPLRVIADGEAVKCREQVARPADGVPEWPKEAPIGLALLAIRCRYHFASFTRAGVTPLVRARAIVAHDRILTGDPRHAQA